MGQKFKKQGIIQAPKSSILLLSLRIVYLKMNRFNNPNRPLDFSR